MQVQSQFILGCHFRNTVCHFNGCLIVSVQKIYLKSTDTHLRILLAGFFQLVIQYIEHRPQYQIHSFALAITNQLFQVQLRNDSQHIPFTRIIPTLIEYNELYPVIRREINIILISLHIDTGFKVNVIDSPIIPPVPCDLSSLYPRAVTNTVGGSQSIHQIIDRHFNILFRHRPYTPRIIACSLCLGNIVSAADHTFHRTWRKALHFGRIFGKRALQRATFSVAFYKHTRIILQIRFQECHLQALSAIDCNRQKSNVFCIDTLYRCLCIDILESHHILVFSRFHGRISHVCLIVLWKIHPDHFILNH